jgi:2-polyprenyl-3-methyl-5-hydroxy-6-metoxy-1,4-benzoquinol methylase
MTSDTGASLAKRIGGKAPTGVECPICSGSRRELFQARLLRKYEVHYFLCETCGLIQTEQPYWLDEAYSSAIADADTGLVSRNLEIAKKLAGLLYFCLDPNAQYLEAAGGYGLLTRLMRDRGFNFRWHDPYCENIFARGFEWDPLDEMAAGGAVTAFEVLEHVSNPVDFIRDALKQAKTRTIIFSTLLYEGEPPRPDKWWYYSLESGQHISFFRRDTLKILANKLGLRLYTHGWFHALTNSEMNELMFRVCTSRLSVFVDQYVRLRMKSKTFDDHERITEHYSRR